MEFVIARDDLQQALYYAHGVAERRTTIPVLSNVKVTAEKDEVTVGATDQQVSICAHCQGTVRKKGSASANGRVLYDIVRELPPGEVTVKGLENRWVEITSGRSRFRVVGIDPVEFPEMPGIGRGPRKYTFQLPATLLGEMIARTLFAVSLDETRVNLSGVFLQQPERRQVRMVATDGHRLALVTRGVEPARDSNLHVQAGLVAGALLPRKGLAELKRVVDSVRAEETVQAALDGNVAHFRCRALELGMRLVEAEFPDYEQVIPRDRARRLRLEVGALQAALRRVAVVSSEVSRGIRLAIEAGKVRLSAINPDCGEAEEEVEAEVDGEPIVIGFNARYLLDVLAVLPSEGHVELGLGDELSPAIVRHDGDPDYLYVVMPMRL